MVNIFGPGLTNDQSTSTRPTQVSTGLGVDQWFKDCSSEAAKDGTRFRAQFFNFIIANFRRAVRGLGVAESEVDDDLLLKCFQTLQFTNWLNLPIFPEVLQSTGLLSVTNLGGGSIRVDAAQEFLHRGWNKVKTNDYDDAARTVAHLANKTYHLRWQYNGGTPIFVLKDVADAVYNPGTLQQYDPAFDTTYDDMLIAKVVTNGSNVPTITPLANKASLSGTVTAPPINGATHLRTLSLAWARTPKVAIMAENNPGGSYDSDYEFEPQYIRRDEIQYYSWSWHHNNSGSMPSMQSPGFTLDLRA